MKVLLSVKYNTDDLVLREKIDDFICNQKEVIREVEGNYTVNDTVKAVLIALKVYKQFGDNVVIIKGYMYKDTINLSKSNIL